MSQPTVPWTLRKSGPAAPAKAAPVQVEDPRLAEVLNPAVDLVTLYTHALWSEGPAWSQVHSALIFSDVRGRRVLRWHPDGHVDTLVDPSWFANGNAAAPDGTIYHCEHGRRGISATTPDGMTRLIFNEFAGKPFNAPNDVIVASDGTVWFTDPTFGLTQPEEGYPAEPDQSATRVYRGDPETGEVDSMGEFDQPNGLAFSPDESLLYVSCTPEDGEKRIVVARHEVVQGGVHRLLPATTFARVPNGLPDGFSVDTRGWVWSTSADGIVVFDQDGTRLGLVPTPDTASNCTFSPSGDRLFITGSHYLWALDLR